MAFLCSVAHGARENERSSEELWGSHHSERSAYAEQAESASANVQIVNSAATQGASAAKQKKAGHCVSRFGSYGLI